MVISTYFPPSSSYPRVCSTSRWVPGAAWPPWHRATPGWGRRASPGIGREVRVQDTPFLFSLVSNFFFYDGCVLFSYSKNRVRYFIKIYRPWIFLDSKWKKHREMLSFPTTLSHRAGHRTAGRAPPAGLPCSIHVELTKKAANDMQVC